MANSQTTALTRGGVPLHRLFIPFPIVCFTGTLLTDIAYSLTDEVMWERFSIWLLSAGLVMAAFAVIAGIIDLLFMRRILRQHPAWFHILGSIIVVALSALNVMVHSRDAYTAVVPQGLILSAIVVLVMIVTNWTGRGMIYSDGVGVTR